MNKRYVPGKAPRLTDEESPMDEGTPPFRYDARLANEIELRWQDRWEQDGTFHAPNRAAPAVRQVLAPGAVRHRRREHPGAVRPAVQPGLHPGRRVHRRPRPVRPRGRGDS